MKNERLEESLYEIISDWRIIRVYDVDYRIRSLYPHEVVYSNFVYRKELERGKKVGLLTEDECIEQAIQKGNWNKEKDQLIALYYGEIRDLEKTKTLYKNNKGKRIKLTNDIKKVQIKLKPLEEERYVFTLCSAESVALSKKIGYVVSRVIMKLDDTQLWETYEDFLNETDSKFITDMTNEFTRLNHRTEKDIRAMARMPTWNIMWSIAKKTGNVFGVPAVSYTKDQLLLCYWSLMYDSVYESMDRPNDKVVEDDEALDKWFEEQRDKRGKESKRKEIMDRSSANRHGEIFVMASSDEDADDIYNLNDKLTLAQMRAESLRLEEKQGQEITEWQLRKKKILREAMTRTDASKIAANRKNAMKLPQFIGGK